MRVQVGICIGAFIAAKIFVVGVYVIVKFVKVVAIWALRVFSTVWFSSGWFECFELDAEVGQQWEVIGVKFVVCV